MIQTKKEKHLPIVLRKMEVVLDPTLPMWVISGFQYPQIDMTKLFSKMKIVKINALVISGSRGAPIMKDISLIGFPYLTILDLSDNQIETIEGIHRMRIPKISRLNLQYNAISRIDSLRKTRLSHLSYLNLGVNKIISVSPLHYFSSRTIAYLNLKYNQNLTNLQTFILLELPFEFLHLDSTRAIGEKKKHNFIDSAERFPTRRKFWI